MGGFQGAGFLFSVPSVLFLCVLCVKFFSPLFLRSSPLLLLPRNDPDVFALVFSTKRIPPNGANRGRYCNPKVDELTDAIRVEMNQQKRKELTSEVQKIVAEDLPYISLWYADVVSVHQRTLGDLLPLPNRRLRIPRHPPVAQASAFVLLCSVLSPLSLRYERKGLRVQKFKSSGVRQVKFLFELSTL